MRRLNREKGSVSVEMSFVFPVVLFIIIIMLFFGLFMYEQVAAQAILDDVVSRAAANWATADEGIYKERSASQGFDVRDVYSRIIDFKDGEKKNKLEKEALTRLNTVCIFADKFKDDDITLDSFNVIIYKTLDLTVDRSYTMPFAGFLRSLGVNPELRYKLSARAIVQDQPELIRTIDIAGDMLSSNPKIKELYNKAQDAMQQLSDFFRDFKFEK